METNTNIDKSTIARFGEQWTFFTENLDYQASVDCLADICGPFFDIQHFKGKHVYDIGSGTGRIVNMLLNVGAASVTAIEPSEAFIILKKNTEHAKDRVRLIQATAESFQEENQFDYVVSFGVLHHIVNPSHTVKSAYRALNPGGKCIIWLYGYEGNRLYLSLVLPLRTITTHLPQRYLLKLSKILSHVTNLYLMLCRYLPLPMRDYFFNHFARMNEYHRTQTIYDQLNPTYAKYYKKEEVYSLLADQGFKNIKLYHRHGYSWTAIGEKVG